MVSKRDNQYVVWPDYLASENTQKEGRLVPKNMALEAPTLDEIERAARQLGLNPVVEREVAYPRSWWKKSGRVLIDTGDSKTALLKAIARTMRDNRKH